MNQTVKFNTDVFTLIEIISNNNQLTISFLSPLTCEEIEIVISNAANTSVIEVETVISDIEVTKVYHKGFTSFNGIRKTTLSSGTMYTVYLSQPSLQEQMAELNETIDMLVLESLESEV